MPSLAYAILVLLILAVLAHEWTERNRCFYCGAIARHDETCPLGRFYDDP